MQDELFDAIYGVRVEAEDFFSELTPEFARTISRELEATGWRNHGDSIEKDIEAISRYFSPEGQYAPEDHDEIDVFYRDHDMAFFVGIRIKTLLSQDTRTISEAKTKAKHGIEKLLRGPDPDLIIYEY